MSVDLSDFIDPLLREVRPPGSTLFGGVVDAAWIGYLSDAFWEVRLDGFLTGYTINSDLDTVEPVESGADITREEMALVILYAGVKVLRNQILSMNTTFRAKAGPVEFEQQNSATMLVEMLRQLKSTKDHIIEAMDGDGEETAVLMIDAYSQRLYLPASYHGSPELMG